MKLPFAIPAFAAPLMKVLTDVHTGPDGKTFDGARIAQTIAVFAIVGFTGYEVWGKNIHFDPVQFATGIATLIAGTGAAVAIKQVTKAEPPATPPADTTPTDT